MRRLPVFNGVEKGLGAGVGRCDEAYAVEGACVAGRGCHRGGAYLSVAWRE